MSAGRLVLSLVSAFAIVVASGCKERRPLPPDGSPNLILISLDTLRADHLGCYGYERPTSPNIDAFATRAVLFETAISTAPKTAPSHMSMFTSLYPSVHGIGMLADADEEEIEVEALHPDIRTLAEILHARGYATAGYHAGGFMRAEFGFGRGFEQYRQGVVDDAEKWIDENARRRPFFLLFHTYQVHDPYTPEPPYDAMFTADYKGRIIHDRRRLKTLTGSKEWAHFTKKFWELADLEDPHDVAHLIALYDGEIAALDAALVSLFETIEKRAPNTIVVILSDHGEQFGEHGEFLHTHVYRELVHVPLLVRMPGQSVGARVEQPVSLIDLAPTLLDLMGIAPLEQFQGRTFAPLIDAARGQPIGTRIAIRNELFSSRASHRIFGVRDSSWRLIATPDGFELYDLAVDPDEKVNVLRDRSATPARAARAFERLQQSLEHWRQANVVVRGRYETGRESERLDDATIEQLRALGYLN